MSESPYSSLYRQLKACDCLADCSEIEFKQLIEGADICHLFLAPNCHRACYFDAERLIESGFSEECENIVTLLQSFGVSIGGISEFHDDADNLWTRIDGSDVLTLLNSEMLNLSDNHGRIAEIVAGRIFSHLQARLHEYAPKENLLTHLDWNNSLLFVFTDEVAKLIRLAAVQDQVLSEMHSVSSLISEVT
ncbi:MAG: hypothetical protein V4719_22465 [Planctomycetota bacterium]